MDISSRSKEQHTGGKADAPHVWSRLSPAKPTKLWDEYWRFAAARQELFFEKFNGDDNSEVSDPVLRTYKFTNAYRASDRVSQYLIKEVIYRGDQDPQDLFFRILLFKLFNKIETWELLNAEYGAVTWKNYSFGRFDHILTEAICSGRKVYSAAYIMPSGKTSFGYEMKHQNNLRLVELLMKDEVPKRLKDAHSLRECFEILKGYPTLGDFLAFQYVIDLNYGSLIDFSEMEFVVAGPGALAGIQKCFSDTGGLPPEELIKWVTESQESEFDRLGIRFRDLFGRPLQLVDCQNLFCEIDKYSRVAYPELNGCHGRKRIKQTYKPNRTRIDYWYPPKWNLDLQQPNPAASRLVEDA